MNTGPDRTPVASFGLAVRSAPMDKEWPASDLNGLGFRRFGTCKGKELTIEVELPRAPAVYLATLGSTVFWIGETFNLRTRFQQYRRWLALPDDSPRKDARARDQLLEMTGGQRLVFYWKEPMQIFSALTNTNHSAHRVEESILIEYFKPAWNLRKGGRRRG